jgi:hypothetical protein
MAGEAFDEPVLVNFEPNFPLAHKAQKLHDSRGFSHFPGCLPQLEMSGMYRNERFRSKYYRPARQLKEQEQEPLKNPADIGR